MLVHNIIKMTYVREGYLPNYPYHLVSDKEMFDAFIVDTDEVDSYFTTNYPCIDEELEDEYNTLKDAIKYHIDNYLNNSVSIPDWVYTYMLGEVISVNSTQQGRHDLLVLLNLDNVPDEFNLEICKSCLEISSNWIHKLPPSRNDHRPPTMFGEPHVIKSLRLLSVNVLS